ncbi:MAG: heavy metal-responsive transcriptional regulator [Cyanobacteriota bacterium]|nr:heavy metal-responsive transcriptional regulator [Cyanobacteriota bacterium]
MLLDRWLKIGQVARQSGLSVKTIRYYEQLGLLAPNVERSRSGYRLFQPSIFNRLAFIKRSQALGLSLNEIRDILEIRDRGELPCEAVKARLLEKLQQIHEQIQALETLKLEVLGILSGWEDQPPPEQVQRTICPNLQPARSQRSEYAIKTDLI